LTCLVSALFGGFSPTPFLELFEAFELRRRLPPLVLFSSKKNLETLIIQNLY
jgi:hypothetical protein